jgi:S-adenosylmethionine hydrolase
MSLITLTTDFGDYSPYAAVMKGVILSVNSDVRIVDLSHRIPPQDVRHGSYFLATTIPYFPPQTIHVAVVDPGVGTERSILLAEACGQFVLAPDNGLLTGLLDLHRPAGMWRITESHFWRSPVSATFHGRDIFAPVAARLASDPTPGHFGIAARERVRLLGQPFRVEAQRIIGCVQFIDGFGNLISNIPSDELSRLATSISVGGSELVGLHWVRTYGEAAPGELVGLISSDGFVEIAVVNGEASRRLGVAAGAAVEIIV